MSLGRQILAKVDRRLLSELDHTKGVQLVKVPASEAVWSTWRRYCDAVGVPMGRGLAVLLHRELASVVDEDLNSLRDFLETRETEITTRQAELTEREEDLKRREQDLAVREGKLSNREDDFNQREQDAVVAERKLAEAAARLPRSQPPAKVRPKRGRNEPCWCGSGKKYKNCHLSQDG